MPFADSLEGVPHEVRHEVRWVPNAHLAVEGVRAGGGAWACAPGFTGPGEQAVPVGREATLSPGLVERLVDVARDGRVGAIPGAQDPWVPYHVVELAGRWSDVAGGRWRRL
eukprot:5042203-Alexandrium_andersonii.AAC.1